MGAGETPEANTVFSTVVSARQALGENFEIEQVLDATNFAALSEVEKAYLQGRLRKELNMELPEGLRVDEAALERAEAQRASAAGTAKAPTPQPEPAEMTLEQKVQGLASVIEQEFHDAQNMGKPFLVAEQMAMYEDALDAQGARMLAEELARRGVIDFSRADVEIPEGVKVSTAIGKPPEQEKLRKRVSMQAEFDYKDRRLLWRRTVAYDDGTSEQEQNWRESDFVVFPPGFDKIIAADPDKLKRAMKGLSEIFKDTDPKSVKVRPIPRQWREQGSIDGFEVYLQNIKQVIPMSHDKGIIDAVNETVEDGGDYWNAPGFEEWRDNQKRRTVKQYIKERVEGGLRSLDWGAEEAAPEAEPTKPPAPEPARRILSPEPAPAPAVQPVEVPGVTMAPTPEPAQPPVAKPEAGQPLAQEAKVEIQLPLTPYEEVKTDIDRYAYRPGEVFGIDQNGELVFGLERERVREDLEQQFGAERYPGMTEEAMRQYRERWIAGKIAQVRQIQAQAVRGVPVREASPEIKARLMENYNQAVADFNTVYRETEQARAKVLETRAQGVRSPAYRDALLTLAKYAPKEAVALPGFPSDKKTVFLHMPGRLTLAQEDCERKRKDALFGGILSEQIPPPPADQPLTLEDLAEPARPTATPVRG